MFGRSRPLLTSVRKTLGLTPVTFYLALFALANLAVITAILLALPPARTGLHDIGLYESVRFIMYRSKSDSWHPIMEAWLYLQDPGDESVYQAIFFDRGVKFQYALTSLLPIELLDVFQSADGQNRGPVKAASWLSVWLMAAFVTAIFFISMRRHCPELVPNHPVERMLLGSIAFAMTLTFYPIARAFSLGQIQSWINCLFGLLVLLWVVNRPIAAGLAAGVICAIKPQLGLLLVWGLLRRQWGFSAAFAGTLLLFGIATLALYGIEHNMAYLDVLSFISRRGEAYYPNQTFNGLLNRLRDNGTNVEFEVSAFPDFDPVVYIGTIATSVVIIGAAMFWRRHEYFDSTLDLLVASLSFTIASPIAWEHHYGVLMPMFAVLLPALIRWPVAGRWTLPILAVGYVLTSNFFNVAQRFAAHPVLTPLQSYLLAGSLIVLALLYLARAASAPRLAHDSHPQPVNSNAPGASAATIS